MIASYLTPEGAFEATPCKHGRTGYLRASHSNQIERVGYFLELSKYLNHAEFRSASDRANPELLALAKQITAIEFSHNLIVIHKGPNTDPSNAP